jgi:2-polyprenyl-6-methoxyphenol hydroxylase-like FAD-dependent oxidoreductase
MNSPGAHKRRALVIGGSMAGLFAASLLHRVGWKVDLFERSDVELSGRGAGIVTHDELLQALSDAGASLDDLGVSISERAALDASGNVIERLEFKQIVTSWDRLHSLMRSTIPNERHHLGCNLLDIHQDPEGVTAVFSNGRSERADLLVGADGFRSGVRAKFLPEITPEYAGYVVWRGLADERDLSPAVHEAIFEKFAFFLPAHNEVIGYPIAGPNNNLAVGARRFNWVWYRRADPQLLKSMLLGEDGVQYEVSIPPPKIRRDLIDGLKADAKGFLPWPFYDSLVGIDRPFFTPIYDHFSPSMVFGRVALVGDAASVGRPHIGMGVTKAAEDAQCLSRCLALPDTAVESGLARFESERLPAAKRAFECGRELGEFMHKAEAQLRPEERARWQRLHGVRAMLQNTASSSFVREAQL